MAQNINSTIHKNVLAWRGCEKLYLDTRTADVFFVFNSENPSESERVPAHKNILSAVSEAFDAMFFGPAKEIGDVKVKDTSKEAFEEFLQYFYRSSVKLTSENAPQVMNLCKQYLLNDCIKNSTDLVESSLTLDNMCWGYELAILFEQNELKEFCEQKICEHPKEIFQSNSFLTCELNLLRHILQLNLLNPLKCDEIVVFDSCIAWAKAACNRKDIDEKNVQNIRKQLGELFYDICGKMTLNSFIECYKLHSDLFSLEDYRDITIMISCAIEVVPDTRKQAKNHSDNEDVIICDRSDRSDRSTGYQFERYDLVENTVFSSNFPLILKRFYCKKLFNGYSVENNNEMHIPIKIRISSNFFDTYLGDMLSFIEVSLSNKNETIIDLPKPLVIRSGVKYKIEFLCKEQHLYSRQRNKLYSCIELDQGICISFLSTNNTDSSNEIVFRMDFVK